MENELVIVEHWDNCRYWINTFFLPSFTFFWHELIIKRFFVASEKHIRSRNKSKFAANYFSIKLIFTTGCIRKHVNTLVNTSGVHIMVHIMEFLLAPSTNQEFRGWSRRGEMKYQDKPKKNSDCALINEVKM